jgi:hypothetical protein
MLVRQATYADYGIFLMSFGVVHIFVLNDFNSFKGESYIKHGLQGFKK